MAAETAASAETTEPAAIHHHLDAAEQAYNAVFEGHVPDEVHRFGQFIATVRMIVDQSADRVSKGE